MSGGMETIGPEGPNPRSPGWNISLGMLTIVDLEPEMITSFASSCPHGDHAGVLVQLEARMFHGLPVELLVGQIPIIQIIDIDPTNWSVWRLSLVVVDEDVLGTRLHFVVIHITDYDG